jgi:hypothetical protein
VPQLGRLGSAAFLIPSVGWIRGKALLEPANFRTSKLPTTVSSKFHDCYDYLRPAPPHVAVPPEETDSPGASLASMIRSFWSVLQRRRRSVPVVNPLIVVRRFPCKWQDNGQLES